MAIVGTSLSKDDIRALRLVSREMCSLATACMKAVTMSLTEHDAVETVERAVERRTGVPLLTAVVSCGHARLLLARGLLPRLQCLEVTINGERDEVATTLQGPTCLRAAVIKCVEGQEAFRLVANCLALQTLQVEPDGKMDVDFRPLSRLSNLRSLTFCGFEGCGELSSITCLTGLTHLGIDVGKEVSLRPLSHLCRLISLCTTSRGPNKLREDFALSCLAAESRGNLKSLRL